MKIDKKILLVSHISGIAHHPWIYDGKSNMENAGYKNSKYSDWIKYLIAQVPTIQITKEIS